MYTYFMKNLLLMLYAPACMYVCMCFSLFAQPDLSLVVYFYFVLNENNMH